MWPGSEAFTTHDLGLYSDHLRCVFTRIFNPSFPTDSVKNWTSRKVLQEIKVLLRCQEHLRKLVQLLWIHIVSSPALNFTSNLKDSFKRLSYLANNLCIKFVQAASKQHLTWHIFEHLKQMNGKLWDAWCFMSIPEGLQETSTSADTKTGTLTRLIQGCKVPTRWISWRMDQQQPSLSCLEPTGSGNFQSNNAFLDLLEAWKLGNLMGKHLTWEALKWAFKT